MNHLKYALTLSLWLFSLIQLKSQSYHVSVRMEPFEFLEEANLADSTAWSMPVFAVPIGFDFHFFDITSDTLYSAENTFGCYTSLNDDEEHLYMLIQFCATLIDRGYSQDSAVSPILFKTEGEVGDRKFTLEYNNAGLFYGLDDENGIYLDFINLQVRLFEESGDIEFHIGPYSILGEPEDVFDGYSGPFIGLFADCENTPGGRIGEVILLSGDPMEPIIVSDPFSPLSWPIPENTVYRFSKSNTSLSDDFTISPPTCIYPNPAEDILYLNEDIVREVTYPIIIFNSLGGQVLVWNSDHHISIEGLPEGHYFAVIQSHGKVIVERISVN